MYLAAFSGFRRSAVLALLLRFNQQLVSLEQFPGGEPPLPFSLLSLIAEELIWSYWGMSPKLFCALNVLLQETGWETGNWDPVLGSSTDPRAGLPSVQLLVRQ